MHEVYIMGIFNSDIIYQVNAHRPKIYFSD